MAHSVYRSVSHSVPCFSHVHNSISLKDNSQFTDNDYFLFIIFRRCSGTCYVYTLSICEAKKFEEMCTCEFEREYSDPETKVSYWFQEGIDTKKWPKPPEKLKYSRVHIGTTRSPFCIYALLHKSYVTASSLTNSDELKFPYDFVQNDCIFRDYTKKLKDKNAEATQLLKKLDLGFVMPKSYMEDFQSEINDIFIQAGTASDASGLHDHLQTIRSTVNRFFANIPILKVEEERQLNSWFEKFMSPILNDCGFMKKENFPDCVYSVFGSSRPDFAYFKHNQGDLLGVMVDTVDTDQSELTTQREYKRKSVGENYCQCYANMIRIANDCVIASLKRGVLVDSITVYALLVSYEDLSAVPMKYYSDFNSDPTIQVGVSGNFAKLFYCTLQC